jgi:hypothetical protein
MVEGIAGRALQAQQTGLRLHGHHLQAQQVARIAQKAPAQGAHAARSPGDEPSQRGGSVGARGQPQGPAMGRQLPVEIRQQAAGLRFHHARGRLHPPQRREPPHLQHHAAGQGHALAVVARARSAHRQRHTQSGTGPGHQPHLLHIARAHGQLGPATRQELAEHRRETMEIARPFLQLPGGAQHLKRRGQPPQLLLQGADQGIRGPGRQGGQGKGGHWRGLARTTVPPLSALTGPPSGPSSTWRSLAPGAAGG